MKWAKFLCQLRKLAFSPKRNLRAQPAEAEAERPDHLMGEEEVEPAEEEQEEEQEGGRTEPARTKDGKSRPPAQ